MGCAFSAESSGEVEAIRAPLIPVVAQAPVHRVRGVPGLDPSGQATYDISLNVPPGRRDMAPSLALRYSSSGGEGHFGQGFDLVGAGSRIHRCQKTIDVDGEASALRFDARDRLCIDGMRLVGPREDSLYWRSGARYQEELAAWRRIERVEPSGDAAGQFVVTTRDGQRNIYGGGSATVYATRGDRAADGSLMDPTKVVVEWRLARIEDAYGNFIAFEYAQDEHPDGSFEHYLTSIRYTGGPSDDPQREVRLHYIPRIGEELTFIAGTSRRLSKLVKSIEMRVRGTTVRRYSLDYQLDEWTHRLLLASVIECDQFDLCREPTTFEWSEPSWSPVREVAMAADPSWLDTPFLLPAGPFADAVTSADFDGDGRDDLLFTRFDSATVRIHVHAGMSRPGGFAESPSLHSIDGFLSGGEDPIMVPLPSGGDRTGVLLRDRIHGESWRYLEYAPGPNWTLRSPDVFGCVDTVPEVISAAPVVADLDGDGAAEAAWTCLTLDPGATVARTEWLVSAFSPEAHWGGSSYPRVVLEAGNERHAPWRIPVDLDGDRRAEVLARSPDDVRLTPIGTPASDLAPVFLSAEDEFVFADLNGDGLADLVVVDGGMLAVQMNTGRGFGPRTLAFEPPASWNDSMAFMTAQHMRVTDFDRDGRADLLLMTADSNLVGRAVILRWRGDRFVPFELPWSPQVVAVGGVEMLGYVTNFVTVLDHDGDGHPGFTQIRFPAGTPLLEIVEPSVSTRPAALIAVHDEHLNPRFEHVDLSDARLDALFGAGFDIHRVCGVDEDTGEVACVETETPRECRASYPLRCVGSGMWVSNALSVDDGVGGETTRTRQYSAARVDSRRGVGLGFIRTQLVSTTDSEVVDTEFDLSQYDTRGPSGKVVDRRFPFAGQVLYEDVFRWPNGELGDASWPPASDRVIAQRTQYGRRLQRAGVDSLGPDVRGYRGIATYEEVEIYDASDWKIGTPFEEEELIHHWRTDHTTDAWGTTVATTFRDLLGATRTWNVSKVSNFVDEFRIGRVDARYVWSAESVFTADRQTFYHYELISTGVHELRRIIVDQGEDEELTIEVNYDDYGNVAKIRESGHNPDPLPGEPSTLVRRAGISYEQTEHIFPESSTNALGHETTYEYFPASGHLGTLTDPNGVAQNWVYDGFDRLVGHIHEGTVDEVTWSRTPDACYKQTSMLQGSPRIETYYDCLDRPTRVVELRPDGRRAIATVVHDSRGNVVSKTLPVFEGGTAEVVEFTYDGLGRLTGTTNPDGSNQWWVHLGRSVQHTNERGGLTEVVFDTMARVQDVGESDSGDITRTNYFYGAFSRVRESVRREVTTRFAYTPRGDLSSIEDPNRGHRSFVHNAFGEVEQEITVDGVRDTDYDRLGRPTFIREPDGTIAEFHYDTSFNGVGRLAKTYRSGDDVSTYHTYDHYGRPEGLATSVGARTFSIQAEYRGPLLHRLRYDLPGSFDPLYVEYAHDAAGRVESVDAHTPGFHERLWETEEREDPLGRSTLVKRGFRVSRAYDPRNGREALYEARVGASVIEAHVYRYERGHYLRADEDSLAGVAYEYDYDRRGRLTSYGTATGSTLAAYDYDAHGNQRLGSNGARRFDDAARPNLLTSAGGVSFAHDELGRRVGRSDGWQATYTAFDLPRRIDDPSGRNTEYTYDAFQGRVRERIGPVEVFRVGQVRQLYEDGHHRETAIGVVVEGERVAELVSGNEQDFHVRWLSEGPLGTTQLALERGSLHRERRADPFGGMTEGANLWSRFGGHAYEFKSPLVDMAGRVYDAENAVFLSPDPVLATSGAGANPYQYAFQNPNTYTDPTGFWPSRRDCLTPCIDHPIDGAVARTPTPDAPSTGNPRPFAMNGGARLGLGVGRGTPSRSTAPSGVEWDLAVANFLDAHGVDDFFAGMGDSLSFGLTARFRNATGITGVDPSSAGYSGGEWAGIATGLGNVPGVLRSVGRGLSRGGAWLFRQARNRARLNSSDVLEGVERAGSRLLEAVRRRRTVQIAAEGTDELRYLNSVGAEANVGGAAMDHILVRSNPSKAALLEEFLHGTQHRLGIISRLGHAGAEWHVKDFMIRHARLLGLGAEDVRRLTILRDMGL